MRKPLVSLAIVGALQLLPYSCIAQSSTPGSTKETEQASKFISQAAKRVGSTQIPQSWEGFTEFEALRNSKEIIRIGYLSAMIFQLETTEQNAIPKSKDSDFHYGFLVVTRQETLEQFRRLIPARAASQTEIIIQDYLDEEISNLQRLQQGKIQKITYQQGRLYRNSKRIQLLGQDLEAIKAFAEASISGSAISLANRVFLFALMRNCVSQISLCAKLNE